MTIRIAALMSLAFPLAVLLGVSGSCQPTGGSLDSTGGSGSGGAPGLGGAIAGGGAGGTGSGGAVGGQAGHPATGGSGRGGSGGTGSGGAGGIAGSGNAQGGAGGVGGASGDRGTGGASLGDAAAKDATGVDSGPVACDDTQSAGRLAVYYYDDSAVSGSSIQMHFDLVNFTAYSSRLQQVTIRYWFTDESPSSANVLEQYYVPIATTMKFTALNPPREGADTMLEMSFRDAPDSGVSWVETRGFNFAFHKASYAGTYDQSNDYSYDPKLTKTLGKNPKITAYVNGALVWGCEPPVQAVSVDAGEGAPDVNARIDASVAAIDGGRN
jgi:hypothetical protein